MHEQAPPRPSSNAGYLLSLALPAMTTAYLALGSRAIAGVWLLSLLGIGLLDEKLRPRARVPPAESSRSMRALPYVIAALQLANAALFVWRLSEGGPLIDAVIGTVLVGVGSAFSTMIVAHELIHRSGRFDRWLGRALLSTALYDHFYTDHLRGHHRHVGTPNDPLTARRGERFLPYLWRSWPGEIASAWRIEKARAGARGWARNEVLRGALVELAIVGAVALAAGHPAAFAFVAQAALAHFVTAAVNYFEHWGIVRDARRVRPIDAWDTNRVMSHYALGGLSFHADHHARASLSFDRLSHHAQSPQLPRGYFGMVLLVLLDNEKARTLLEEELRRVGLAGQPDEVGQPSLARLST